MDIKILFRGFMMKGLSVGGVVLGFLLLALPYMGIAVEQEMSSEEFVVRLRVEGLVQPGLDFCRRERPEIMGQLDGAFVAYHGRLEKAARELFAGELAGEAGKRVSEQEWQRAMGLAALFVRQKERTLEPGQCDRLLEMLQSRTVERLGKEVRKDYLNYRRFVADPVSSKETPEQ